MMRRVLIAGAMLAAFCGCGEDNEAVPTPVPTNTATVRPSTATPPPTATTAPTLIPTATSVPTASGVPTNTPVTEPALLAAIDEDDTVITVINPDRLPPSGIVQIDDELIAYSGISGNALTGVTRGFAGTDPSSHLAGASLIVVPTPTPTSTEVPTSTAPPTATPIPTSTPAPSHTATALPTSTATSAPTQTPPPTATPVPTATAVPTATPVPTATETAFPTSTPSPTATSLPTDTPEPGPTALAKRISDGGELIGGPLAVGRVGDYLLANDRIRVIIRDVGRQFSFLLTYGGNIVDADIVRPEGVPGNDNFGSIIPFINISSTAHYTGIEVINSGENGEPAVIRATGVDDLFDAVDPTNAVRGLGAGAVPVSAQDRDIPVEIVTEYSLAAGSTAVRIVTTIKNNGPQAKKLYIGDVVNGSGQVDTFAPGLGFGEGLLRLVLQFLAYPGGAADVTYGVVPGDFAGSFTQSGLTFYLIGQDVLSVLLGQAPGFLNVPAGGTGSYSRQFVVGDGDVNSVAEVYYDRVGSAVGQIRGRVTAGGAPAAGAVVSLVQKPGDAGAEFNVVNSYRTDASGEYSGELPAGDYFALARLEGYPYDSGSIRPTEHPITMTAGGSVVQDFTLPATAELVVNVTDQSGAPIPAKISIVGFDPAPDPGNVQQIAIITARGSVFGTDIDNKGSIPYGLTGVHFADGTGSTGAIKIPPSTYEIFVSHGPEYSVFRQRVTLAGGETTSVDAQIARVVDTGGFVSADYHVHMISSPDSFVSREDRILTMAAEGVDYFVASDHDFLTDLGPLVSSLGLEEFTRSVVSDEITTFNYGHFNAWPLRRDPDSITGGAIDWGRSGVPPGMDYPSLGSYDLSPAEMFALAASRFDGDSGVLQINHVNDPTLGFLHLAGIDTKRVPPQSFTNPALIRQNPAITNLYDDNYDALEIWIEANRAQTERLLASNIGDWFNLLNQGRLRTGTADSDTHHTAIVQAGGPRNFVASSSDLPAELIHGELAQSVRNGRVIGSSAPFIRFTIEGDDGAVAGLDLQHPTLVRATAGSATIHLNIQSPEWAPFDTVEVYTNTATAMVPDVNFNGATVPRYTAAPAVTRRAGTDFTVRTVTVRPDIAGANRLEADLDIPLTLGADAWVVVFVKGTDGVSAPIWPMNPQDIRQSSNTTLDQLTDGNLGEDGNPALAFTNPLYVDVDGNGQFDPPVSAP